MRAASCRGRNRGRERQRCNVSRHLLGLLLCAAALSACGRADDDRAVVSVTSRFLEAVRADDGARACAQLSVPATEALEDEKEASCAESVLKLDLEPSAVRHSDVFGVGAKVDLTDGRSAFLELTSEGWRLSAVGCEAGAGDEPFTCELDA
jgi:hypothetical protein